MLDCVILLVEDDASVRELVQYHLRREGMRVLAVESGEEGLRLAFTTRFDLILLDLMLPGIDGMAVCRSLKARKETREVPVIILTAKQDESDVETAFQLGADDYVTKPFSPRLLVARIRAVLRRRPRSVESASDDLPASEEVMEHHGLTIHQGRHEIAYQGQPVALTSLEFRVLCLLAGKPGWVFAREQILRHIHGPQFAVTERAVDVLVVNLRRKLGPAGSLLETVRGAGYRFKP